MTPVNDKLHPDQVLLNPSIKNPCVLACCEHIAGSEKFQKKALQMQLEFNGAFDITCDLEDGIAAGDAIQATDTIINTLHSTDNKYDRVGVRLLPFQHPDWTVTTTQLIKEAGNKIAYLTVPKLGRQFELVYIASCLKTIADNSKIDRKIPLHVLIETKSILPELALLAAHPDIQTLDFGIMDFVADHDGAIDINQIHSPAQFDHRLISSAKLKIVETALAAGIVPSHNVTVNYTNPDVVFTDAKRAHTEFGFLRMWSIHPNQISQIIKAMQPSLAELEQAAEILIAAYHKSWAPLGFNGLLYDRAAYRSLWQKLKRARKNGIKLPNACEQLFFESA